MKEHLSQQRPKWPVPLTEFVSKDAKPIAKAPAATAPKAAAPETTPPPAATSSASSDSDSFHPKCTKDQADALLLADGGADVSGKYLVRASGSQFVLSVIYKGSATHHKLTRASAGAEFSINGQPTGQTSIAGVATYLGQKRPKWPVPLTQCVPPDGSGASVQPTASAPKPEPAVVAPAAAVPSSSGTSEYGDHFHGNIPKDKADQLLLANNGADGKWLVRSKGDSTDLLILSVIYKGNATHHALVRTGAGEEFTLNKAPTGCTTVAAVEKYLTTKRPKWPVPLTEGVRGVGSAGTPQDDEEEAPPPPPRASQQKSAPPPAAAGDAGAFTFEHPVISKEAADRLLLADGGADISGKFLFRAKQGTPGEYILSVIYKKKPTHHNVALDASGAFTVNKESTGCTTLAEVASLYGAKRPKWPVPLTIGVPGPIAQLAAKAEAAPVTSAPPAASAAKGHSRSGSGDNGFTNWTPPASNGQTSPEAPSLQKEGPSDGIGSVHKREITKTWRRKKLAALESKPTALGQWATDGHGSTSHAYGNYDLDAAEEKHKETLAKLKRQESVALEHGLMLTKSAARRLTDPQGNPVESASPEPQQVKCTFLGNCQCPNCV